MTKTIKLLPAVLAGLLFGGCLGGCKAAGEKSLEDWKAQIETVSATASKHGMQFRASANWDGKLFELDTGGFSVGTGVDASIELSGGGPAQIAHEMWQHLLGQQAMNEQRIKRIEDQAFVPAPPQ